jgi:adenylate cyclase
LIISTDILTKKRLKRVKMKKVLYFITFFGVVGFNIFSYLFYPSSLQIFDNKLRDEMFLIRGEINTTNSVVIVDIDEKSLKTLGQWPWSRDVISQILINLTNSEALIVGLDLFFAERDTKSPYFLAKKYNLNIAADDYDQLLAEVLANTPTILGYLFDFEKNLTKNILPNIPAIFIQRNKKDDFLLKAKGYIGNIPILQNNTYSAGFVNMIPDIDGVVRNVPLLIEYDDIIYPSLAFEMFRIASGNRRVVIDYSEAGIEDIKLGNYKIKTDRFGRIFINYRGDKNRFTYISAIDIYENNFDKNLIKDKFVLIGTSAGGLFDLRVTPFNTVYPGVEVHANIIDNLIKGDLLVKPDMGELIDIIVMFIVGLIVFVVFYFLSAVLATSLVIFMIIGYFIFSYYLMFYYGYIVNVFLPIVEIIVLVIIFGAINYFLESKKAETLKHAFAKKVSANVMNELISHTQDDILAPRDKDITIFFSDIRSFTSISEKLANPTKVIQLLNLYMTPMVENITIHKGTVDKFIGDAIMAYWNAPVDIENHADEAVSSAIEQIKILKKLNKQIKKEFDLEIDIGIGINSGIATIGEMGSSGRADYTVIGDNVNLASRLEGLNKVYHSHILISEFTYELLKKDYIIREIDLVRVKGKSKPVKIYQVIDFGEADFSYYYEALELYRNSQFDKAKEIFEMLYNSTKDELYNVYQNRCQHFISNPPDKFDGVWTFTTK